LWGFAFALQVGSDTASPAFFKFCKIVANFGSLYRFAQRKPTKKRVHLCSARLQVGIFSVIANCQPEGRRYNTNASSEVIAMSHDYLLKTEPSEYSFADLLKDGTTEWEGVTAPAAVKHLREMVSGARLIIYETGSRKTAVGTATVVSVDANDPKNPVVKIKAGKAIAKPVSLEAIKANKIFKDSPLIKIGRLSVVPLTKEQYAALTGV
jgi:predicted RNA-binding protein with PUA-like domain